MALMPEGQPEAWGIPLWEAIERWTPRELWERYREFAKYDIPLLILGQKEDPRHAEARRLRSKIDKILIKRLVGGELIASGIALPLKETSRRRDIRAELWPHLAFSLDFSMVMGNGLKYDGILIREASSVPREEPASRLRPAPRHPPVRPGRPSVMPMIRAEMRRRAARGLIEESLGREARALASWAQQRFADAHVPKPKSIERKLGPVYKELKRTKRPDK
jgi:hypothetical protein